MITERDKRLNSIQRWMPSDGFGIGHPIHEDELEEDIRYLYSLVPKELKHKKEIPTVIEYQGRRYVLDDSNRK